jgi:hypothetical protein
MHPGESQRLVFTLYHFAFSHLYIQFSGDIFYFLFIFWKGLTCFSS